MSNPLNTLTTQEQMDNQGRIVMLNTINKMSAAGQINRTVFQETLTAIAEGMTFPNQVGFEGHNFYKTGRQGWSTGYTGLSAEYSATYQEDGVEMEDVVWVTQSVEGVNNGSIKRD